MDLKALQRAYVDHKLTIKALREDLVNAGRVARRQIDEIHRLQALLNANDIDYHDRGNHHGLYRNDP